MEELEKAYKEHIQVLEKGEQDRRSGKFENIECGHLTDNYYTDGEGNFFCRICEPYENIRPDNENV